MSAVNRKAGDRDAFGLTQSTFLEPNDADDPLAGSERAGGRDGYAGVVFNRPLEAIYTYRIPEALRDRVEPGQRVRVPLGRGNSLTVGYCVDVGFEPPQDLSARRIKPIHETLDDPPLIDPAMLELTRWIARYYACSWGQALDAVLPGGVKKQAGTRIRNVLVPNPQSLDDPHIFDDLSPKQSAALKVVQRASRPLTVAEVASLAHCGTAPIASLRQRGLVQLVRERGALQELDDVLVDPPDALGFEAGSRSNGGTGEADRPALTADQARVLRRLTEALGLPADHWDQESPRDSRSESAPNPSEDSGSQDVDASERGSGFAAFLLHGVTGSGKTEVYLRAIEAVLQRGREAIVLVPEISLTPQTIRRFRQRFQRVAVLHSHLSDAERHRHWQAIASGRVQVVVGARSAVFAPTRRLGLIVIDEEHETTFKQETTPRYHARDVAVKRAQLCGVPILLGSATPSLETWHNSQTGRYGYLGMPRRVAQRSLPRVDLIDLRHERLSDGRGKPPLALSRPLRNAVAETLREGGQAILLLNRRGFHTFVVCPKCGHVFQCDACDIALTYHRQLNRLVCHTCDAEHPKPEVCPTCQHRPPFFGGLGTEQLERQVCEQFPEATVQRMDSDTMRSPGSYERVLASFRDGEIQILLGTQMIAKGLDFPNVTLVGVVSADTSLHLPDFRAGERTFQLVAQVAGRTGRGDRPGRVLVQTFCPEASPIAHASKHDYGRFVADEMPERERAGLPPFGRVVRILARGSDEAGVSKFLDEVADLLQQHAPPEVRIFGPAPAPVLKIRNRYRYHLQLRAPGAPPLQQLLRDTLPAIQSPPGHELAVDVDPINML